MSKTILLADDSVTIQKVIELTFMDEDYHVVAASNGDEAIEKLDEIEPDIVITDIHMPGADGYVVAQRSKELRPAVPVLLLVGTFEPFDEEKAELSGADRHLKKPFDSQELQRQVDELLSASSEAAAATSDSDTAAESSAAPEAVAADSAPASPAADFVVMGDTGESSLAGEFSLAGETEGGSAVAEADPEIETPTGVAADSDVEEVPAISLDNVEEVEVQAASAEDVDYADPADPVDRVDVTDVGHETSTIASESFASDSQPADDLGSDRSAEESPVAEVAPSTFAESFDLSTESTPDPEPAEADADDSEDDTVVSEPPTIESSFAFVDDSSGETEVAPPSSDVDEATVLEIDELDGQGIDEVEVGAGGGGLSDEDVERIAQRVAEIVGDRVVESVAWEVVPDLAEILIRDRLRELESQVD